MDAAGDDDLLAPLDLAANPEIDVLAHAETTARGLEPPAGAAGQAQQRRLAGLHRRHLDGGVKVKAHGEILPPGSGEGVLAPEIIAVGAQVEPPAVDHAEAFEVTVVAGVDPDIAIGLAASAGHPVGAAPDGAVGEDLGRVGVADDYGGMGGGGARHGAPLGIATGVGAAVDDQPLLAHAHLEAERAGMIVVVDAGGGRRADFRDHHRPAGGKPFETGVGRTRGRPPPGVGLEQHPVDQPGLLLAGVVEQGQPAVAVAEKAQHRDHAVDGGLQAARRLLSGGREGGADIDQVAQNREMHRRAALVVAAVGADLAVELAIQQSEPPSQPRRLAGQARA